MTPKDKIENFMVEYGMKGKSVASIMDMPYQTFKQKKYEIIYPSGNKACFKDEDYEVLLKNLWIKVNAQCIREGVKAG